MKKLISPIAAGLMPLFKSDLTILQDNVYAALLSYCKGISQGYSFVLQGMTTSVSGGTDLVIAEGYWWRHDSNEIIYFPGATLAGSLVGSVTKTGTTTTTKTFKDGSIQNAYEESTSGASSATLSPTPVTNGMNFSASGTDQTLLKVLIAGINENDAWTGVTFQNGWADGSAPASVQYRKNTNGVVRLRGDSYRAAGAATTVMFNLPAGYRPTRDLYFYCPNASGAYILVVIHANGDVQISNTASTLVNLDNITFTND